MKTSVVFLPGTLCNEVLFHHQVASLAPVTNSQVIPLTEGRTVMTCAAWILRQTPVRFALVGFSQGGLVALEIMRQAPERVLKLCLIGTNPRGSTQQNLDTWSDWRHKASAGKFADIVDTHSRNVYGSKWKPEVRNFIERMANDVGLDTFLLQTEMLSTRVDSRPSLGTIPCPTLLLVGRQDRVTPLELHEEMRDLKPGAALVPIEECGHYAPLEQPQAVSASLHYWLHL